MNLFNELKRRNVFRVGFAYAVVGWLVVQVADLALENFGAPGWVMKTLLLFVLMGFVLSLFIAWAYELTPDGIKRAEDVDPNLSVTHATGHKLDRLVIIVLLLAVGMLLFERFWVKPQPASPLTEAQTDIRGSEPFSQEPKVQASDIDDEKRALTPLNANEVADPGIRSVAVLPFVNMSSDPEQEYFSDGLSEELLNRLAQNEKLRVAARTSSFQFKGQTLDIGEIGRKLKVDNILEGSVRKSANRLRITAQLIQVETGYHLWSETYERKMDDVFAIQDDISLAITMALEAELGTNTSGTSKKPTENLEAYQLYLQARYLLAERGGDNMLKSVELFKQATTLDGKFSEAWSGLAFTYSLLPVYTMKISASNAHRLALESAGNAIRIDPESAEAYMALGRINARTDLDMESARYNFEKAYQLAPNNVDIVNIYGDFLTLIGDFSKALKIESRAIELDPLAAVHHSDLAFLNLILNRPEQALEFAKTATSLAPDSFDRIDAYIVSLIMLGQYEQAIEAIHKAENMMGADKGYATSWQAMLYYHQNDRENLKRVVLERRELAKSEVDLLFPTITAFYIAWLDGVEAAIPLLQQSYDSKEQLLVWPEYFYLPELVSDNPAWLDFWQKPGLAELIKTRREYGPYENIGYWKEPPQ